MKKNSNKMSKHSRWKRKRLVQKSSGRWEPFSVHKLQRSIKRSGLPGKSCAKITDEVARSVDDGVNTKEIFKKTFKLIESESSIAATHYSLKRAITELGPTGFEFEKYVAKYFQSMGYQTEVGLLLQGNLVKHEIDVKAVKSNQVIFCECKFHNFIGRTNDVKIPLYVKSRWDDLMAGSIKEKPTDFYIVSNTAFSQDALTYADGIGLKTLGVNAPKDETFIQQIIRLKLYPITSLRRLRKHIRLNLLAKNILLCEELLNERKFLRRSGMFDNDIDLLFNDILDLLGERT